MNKFRFLLLTNSYKDGGYCVAGINLDNGCFVRLVADEALENSSIPKEFIDCEPSYTIFDVLEIVPIRAVPYSCQTENILIDVNIRPKKLGSESKNIIYKFVDTEPTIFGNKGKCVHSSKIDLLQKSLGLYIVQNFKIHCYFDEEQDKYINKCSFTYGNNDYDYISLTDPEYRKLEMNEVSIARAAIVVSLPPEPFGDSEFYHKFVAKVIEL